MNPPLDADAWPIPRRNMRNFLSITLHRRHSGSVIVERRSAAINRRSSRLCSVFGPANTPPCIHMSRIPSANSSVPIASPRTRLTKLSSSANPALRSPVQPLPVHVRPLAADVRLERPLQYGRPVEISLVRGDGLLVERHDAPLRGHRCACDALAVDETFAEVGPVAVFVKRPPPVQSWSMLREGAHA